ncbi:MAG TPA: hypothetical protein VE623_04130 [Acidimicrobiales bacterium]|nr:hypothetical protein [Acidimicrobiales bacterium]
MTRSAGDEDPSLDEAVGRLDDAALRRLLVTAAAAHEDVSRAVRLAAADDSERLAVLRAEVDRGLRTRRHLGYWESSAWARDASPVVDALAEAAVAGPSAELVLLLERAVGHLVKVILRADDSDGLIGDLARRVLDLHQMACTAGVADPVTLARWMVRFTFDDQDFFVVDPVAYVDALGDKGLATYRKEVAKRSGPVEVTPLRRDLWDPFPSFAARYAAERLAVIDRDADRLIELLGGDLSSPHQFTWVAEAMVELGRDDDALAWALRGIAETNGWQVSELYDLAARLLHDRNDIDAVLALRREQHERVPSSSTYALLKTAATARGTWESERDAARSVLARDPGGLVDALLTDGDTDEAWTVATAGGWEPDPRRWKRLAEAREASDPAGALGVYLRLTDTVLVDANKGVYRDAVRHLKAARRAANSAGLVRDFDEKLASLREQHRRRPTFIAMLDKAGLR